MRGTRRFTATPLSIKKAISAFHDRLSPVSRFGYDRSVQVDAVIERTGEPTEADDGSLVSDMDFPPLGSCGPQKPYSPPKPGVQFATVVQRDPPLKNPILGSPTDISSRSFTQQGQVNGVNTNLKGRNQRKAWNRIFERLKQRCFRCGGTGHRAATCRCPKLCFFCKSTGHIVSNCPKRFPLRSFPPKNPSPSSSPIKISSSSEIAPPTLPISPFCFSSNSQQKPREMVHGLAQVVSVYEDDAIREMEAELDRSVVVVTNETMTYSMVMAGVQHYFINISGSSFTVRKLNEHKY